jgi:hypothetical protein
MNKNIVIPIFILIFFIVLSGVYLIFFKQTIPFHSPLVSEKPSPTIIKINDEWNTYNDPSGFTFQYPKTYVVDDNTKKNPQAYADLTIQKPQMSGKILLTITDTSFTSFDEWLKKNKTSSPEGKIESIKLADIEAKQFPISEGLHTIAFDKQILISIILNEQNKKESWRPIYHKLIESFAFVQPEKSSDSSGSSTTEEQNDVIFEGEEVIE